MGCLLGLRKEKKWYPNSQLLGAIALEVGQWSFVLFV
jgi:hypothetical protein